MDSLFSDRISDVPKSFIREILKVAVDQEVISFAGGLPNRTLFPVEELKIASAKVFDNAGAAALQYANSEGLLSLREFIAQRYKQKFNLDVPLQNILITSGSQQGLDLVGKTLLNEGDSVIIEEPGYLGAIQAFSIYKATFHPVPVHESGMNLQQLQTVCAQSIAKLMYTVPNFQNPSGISYSEENRREVVNLLKDQNMFLIEDDPYGDLRYSGSTKSSFKQLMPDKTIMLGSFSKTVVPGFRLGWIVAPDKLYEKLLIAKQASDLHTNQFAQHVMATYLAMGNFDNHVAKIREVYNRQREIMITCIKEYFPDEVKITNPEGGMFLWVTLPGELSSMKLFYKAIERKVAFVPGQPFYINRAETNNFRLNFSNVDGPIIQAGIQRLGKAIDELLATQ